MAADEDFEVVVGEGDVVGVYEAGDVVGLGEVEPGDPAWVDDVDEHEDLGGGDVDEYVSCFFNFTTWSDVLK